MTAQCVLLYTRPKLGREMGRTKHVAWLRREIRTIVRHNTLTRRGISRCRANETARMGHALVVVVAWSAAKRLRSIRYGRRLAQSGYVHTLLYVAFPTYTSSWESSLRLL